MLLGVTKDFATLIGLKGRNYTISALFTTVAYIFTVYLDNLNEFLGLDNTTYSSVFQYKSQLIIFGKVILGKDKYL